MCDFACFPEINEVSLKINPTVIKISTWKLDLITLERCGKMCQVRENILHVSRHVLVKLFYYEMKILLEHIKNCIYRHDLWISFSIISLPSYKLASLNMHPVMRKI